VDPGRGGGRDRRCGQGERRRELPRRSAPVGMPRSALDVRSPTSPGRSTSSMSRSPGSGRPGRSMLIGSRGVRRRRDPLSADGRWGDAPGRPLRGGGRLRARPPRRRLADDQKPTPACSLSLAASPSIELDPGPSSEHRRVPPGSEAPDAPAVVAAARDAGVLVVASTRGRIRAVTHLDVTRARSRRRPTCWSRPSHRRCCLSGRGRYSSGAGRTGRDRRSAR